MPALTPRLIMGGLVLAAIIVTYQNCDSTGTGFSRLTSASSGFDVEEPQTDESMAEDELPAPELAKVDYSELVFMNKANCSEDQDFDAISGFTTQTGNPNSCQEFSIGGSAGGGFSWCHQNSCIGNELTASPEGLMAFVKASEECPQNYTAAGNFRFLLLKADTCAFDPAGSRDNDWNWCQAKVCKAQANALPAKGNISYQVNRNSCPTDFQQVGSIGFITSVTTPCHFNTGTKYSNDWNWCHPVLCVRSTQ